MKGPYYWLIGSLLEPEDDFAQRLRKNLIGWYFLPGSLLTMYAIVDAIVNFDRTLPVTARLIYNIIMTLSWWMTYAWVRKTRHVSGLQAAIPVWTLLLCSIPKWLTIPQHDGKSASVLIALMGIFLQIPYLPVFLVTCCLGAILNDWNTAYLSEPSRLVVLPGYDHNQTPTQIFMYAVGITTVCLSLVAYTFVLVMQETERRGAAQKAANEVTLKILKFQRKYDTATVTTVIEESKAAGVVNAELLDLFQEMNVNLESYRPFLPNFLFLGPSAGVVDEDAMSVMLSTGVVEGMDGEVPSSSSEDHTPKSSEEQKGEGSTRRSSGDKQSLGSPNLSQSLGSPNPEVQNVLQADFVQLFPPPSPPPLFPPSVAAPVVNGSGYRGIICQAWVEICSSEWFSTRLTHHPFASRTSQHQRNTLALFTDALFDLAQSAKASVHSLAGDAVQLTWNATHRVAQPELKAALFLLRLKQALATALPDLKLAGACCAGHAEVHNTISSSTRQQAMYVDAPWLPALDACYTLAKRYKTLIVDANIESGCHQLIIAQGVDCVRYVPKVAVVPGTGEPALFLHPGVLADGAFEPEGFPPSAPDHFDTLLGVTGAQQEESAKMFLERTPIRYTLAFELIKRKAEDIHDEDDWLYGADRAGGDSAGKTQDIEPMLTGALMMCVDGQLGQAAAFVAAFGPTTLEKDSANVESTKAKAYVVQTRSQKLSLLGKRVIDFCSEGRGVQKNVHPDQN